MFKKDKPVHKLNLKKELKNKKEEIVKDILISKQKAGNNYESKNFLFPVFSQHNDLLYKLFIDYSKKLLNKFSIKDSNFKVFCYFTGLNNYDPNEWHNHQSTATINSVLYMKTIKDYGINFKNNNECWYVEPKDFDFLIFPSFLNHFPVTSKTQQRISLNLELRCNESDKEIFGL
jgi:hypothetical protein